MLPGIAVQDSPLLSALATRNRAKNATEFNPSALHTWLLKAVQLLQEVIQLSAGPLSKALQQQELDQLLSCLRQIADELVSLPPDSPPIDSTAAAAEAAAVEQSAPPGSVSATSSAGSAAEIAGLTAAAKATVVQHGVLVWSLKTAYALLDKVLVAMAKAGGAEDTGSPSEAAFLITCVMSLCF